MAGHSKWKNIRIKKGRVDAQKGKIFTKLSRDILMACRLVGGPDPDANFRLKDAILRAREASMPRDNIERVLEKARGAGGADDLDEVVYEGYGPGGVAIIVEAATNNRNRTAAEVRLYFSKNGGNLGESGAVSFLFERKGQVSGPAGSLTEDRLTELAIEAGADDAELDDEGYTLLCEIPQLQAVRAAAEAGGLRVTSCELTRIPKTSVQVGADVAPQLLKLMDLLEDHDDVQQVHANFELSDEVLEGLTS